MAFARWIVGAGAIATPLTAQAQQVSAATGVEYTSGDYGGGSDTEVIYAPLSLSFFTGDWNFRATLPYLSISGPGVFLGEDIPIARGRDPLARTASESVSGFGDVSLSVTKTTRLDEAGMWELDVTGRVKLPTASESDGLGTGSADYLVAADLIRNAGTWSLFAGGGYRMNGDFGGQPLNDTVFAGMGAVRYSQDGTSWGVAYDFSEAPTPDAGDSNEVSSWLGLPMGENARVQLYGLVGLSQGGPEYGGGLRISLDL